MLLMVAPAFCWLFCALYGGGTVADLPVAVCDSDGSALSRAIIRSIDATKVMNVVAGVASPEELKRGIAAGTWAAGFYLPPRMEADVKAGRQVQPVLFRNGVNYIVSSSIARDGLAVFRTINAGLVMSRLRKSGLGARQSLALVSPVTVDASNLYNPSFNYRIFLSPGIIFAQFGMLVMISAAICFAREREHGGFSLFKNRAFRSPSAVLLGKSIPYVLCISVLTALLLFVLFPLYGIGSPAELLPALPAVALYLIACWWMGALAGMVSGKSMLAAEVGIFLGMPSFIFSGWTFPLPAAPGIMAQAAQILPFTHFMPLWFGAALMHEGVCACPGELLKLLAIAVICCAATLALCTRFQSLSCSKRQDHPEEHDHA